MPICFQCRADVVQPCVLQDNRKLPANAIVVASDWELRRVSFFRRLAIATANLVATEGLSRRQLADWQAHWIYLHEGPIFWPDGTPFEIWDTLIDDAYNDDQSFRWLSSFVKFAVKPPKQAPQNRILMRLRLLSLAFQIQSPEVAKHFCR